MGSTPTDSKEPDVATLPEPLDPLPGMLSGGDVGASIAALVMMTEKDIRKAARQDRDLMYQQQEQAQRDELDAMKKGADLRLATGLIDGGLKLGSAACSLSAANSEFRAAEDATKLAPLDARLTKEGSLTDADMGEFKRLSGEKADLTHDAKMWGGTATGLEAYGTISGAVGKAISDSADRDAKAAANRGDKFKRLAEDRADDVHDADKAIDKTIEFFQQWLTGKAAAESAALHRA